MSHGIVFGLCILCFTIVVGLRDLPQELLDDIRSHQDDVEKIVNHMLTSDGKGQTFGRMTDFADKFGHRFTGSQALEDSIDHLLGVWDSEDFDNVHGENVSVPVFKRGNEYAYLTKPVNRTLDILGLGFTVGTAQGITAPVIVVRSFEELDNMPKPEVLNSIVVYNQEWDGYSSTNLYRTQGAAKAAEAGAVAALVKSVTPFSLYTPHTGMQNYDNEWDRIPVASITVEDAEMLQSMYDREPNNLEVHLYMDDDPDGPNSQSRNAVAEIKGNEHPEEVVMFGGHIDSWDVGTGVMDDLGGCFISWQAMSTIKALGLTPRRTMRMVLWTAEEIGIIGGDHYYEVHKNETENMIMAMESDSGTFEPYGITFNGSGMALAIMEEIMDMLSHVELNGVQRISGSGGADIRNWWDAGVPGGSLWIDREKYFWYHHTKADTMTMMNSDHLDYGSIAWTVANYVVANLKEPLPRDGEYPGGAATQWTLSSAAMIMWSCLWSILKL